VKLKLDVLYKVLREKGRETADAGAGFLLYISDGRLVLSNNISFTREEIETFIDELCTN